MIIVSATDDASHNFRAVVKLAVSKSISHDDFKQSKNSAISAKKVLVLVLLLLLIHRGSQDASHQSTLANQNVTVFHEKKAEEWLPCFAYKLKYSSRVKDQVIRNQTFKISHGTYLLMVGDFSRN